MPLCKGSRRKKGRGQDRIELSAVLKFIRFIQLLACCILAMAFIGIIIARKDEGAVVIYSMVIAVNLIIIVLGRIPVKYFINKENIFK